MQNPPDHIRDRALKIRAHAEKLCGGNPDWYASIIRGVDSYLRGTNIFELPYTLQLVRYPVDIETFIFSPDYLGKDRDEIYPEVLNELKKINNPGGLRLVNPYTQALFTGGIGSAKSSTALYTMAYQVYVLSCFKAPHLTFGLDRSSEIAFIFQSIDGGVANVDYSRFYAMVSGSPYFREVFPYNHRLKSELHFPHRIEIKPISDDGGTIGQNVMGGLIDELNFMAIIQNSRRSIDGGAYNQATAIYHSVSRRRKTRFLNGGASPGILCLVSSKRYPGEFTDKILEDAETDPSIYVYDKRVWDVKPKGTFSNRFFRVFAGDLSRKARVLEPHEEVSEDDKPLVVEVPEDFRKEFSDDIVGSLRDIAGVSTISRHPFFTDTDALAAAFSGPPSILTLKETDFVTSTLGINKDHFRDIKWPRWIHVDLGQTNDAAGVSCGYCPEFRLSESGVGMMPVVKFDFTVRVKPPANGEINFAKIRRLIILLREMGVPVKWVSFDSFQSVDSIQMLRSRGFQTGKLPGDNGNAAYVVAKAAFYDRRVVHPPHPFVQSEFAGLERHLKTGLVDHPPNGSKDCSDAVAGVIYGLTMRREVWAMHKVAYTQALKAAQEAKMATQKESDGDDE